MVPNGKIIKEKNLGNGQSQKKMGVKFGTSGYQ